jgi:hypothetical protein
MITGPAIVRDGLVFGYDADNRSKRFYPGEPTVNYIYNENARVDNAYDVLDLSSFGGTMVANHPGAIYPYRPSGSRQASIYYNGGVSDPTNSQHAYWVYDEVLKRPVVVMIDKTGNWQAKYFTVGMNAWNTYDWYDIGVQYTISWLQWVDNLAKRADVGLYTRLPSGTYGFHDGQSYGSNTSTNSKTHTWERVYHTYTVGGWDPVLTGIPQIFMYGHALSRGTLKISDVQLEVKPHPTPFVNGTRTATQSILDLTGTHTIDLSNMIFDSNALPYFDGTDFIEAPFGLNVNPSVTPFTVEVVVKANNPGDARMYFAPTAITAADRCYFASYGGYWRMGIQGSGWSGGNTLVTTDYTHIIIVMSGTSADQYVNGVYDYSKPYTSYTIPTNFNIGRGNGYNWFGEIPVVKIYNRALSADEVKQNFNAYKHRFNIQ